MRLIGLLFLLLAAPAQAGVLVEGLYEGTPVRAEVGDDRSQVLLTIAGRARLVDLAAGTIASPDGAGKQPAGAALAWNPDFRVDALGGGAMVAGQLGSYRLVTEGPRICGELLVSAWMKPFMEPIAQAIALAQRDEARLAPRPRHGCSPMGFALLTEQGWPLLASGRDATIWRTTDLRFDHRPSWAAAPPGSP